VRRFSERAARAGCQRGHQVATPRRIRGIRERDGVEERQTGPGTGLHRATPKKTEKERGPTTDFSAQRKKSLDRRNLLMSPAKSKGKKTGAPHNRQGREEGKNI